MTSGFLFHCQPEICVDARCDVPHCPKIEVRNASPQQLLWEGCQQLFLPMITGHFVYVAMLIGIQSSAHPVLKKTGIQAMFPAVSHPHCRGTSTSAVRMVDFFWEVGVFFSLVSCLPVDLAGEDCS